MKSRLSLHDVIFVATLSPVAEEERRRQWDEFFGACFVPVMNDEPRRTLLLNGNREDCVFIDFDVGGPRLKDRITNAFRRRTPNPILDYMLEQKIYPIRLVDVTVIRAPRRFWLA